MSVVHAVIGYGRLGQVLVRSLRGLGHTVRIGRRELSQRGAKHELPAQVLSPQLAAMGADWVWLAVPDDAIAATAASLPWRAGQLALHCSGATPLQALAPAPERAGFHPLKLLSGAQEDWAGAAVGIEAAPARLPALQALAGALGLRPLALPHPMSSTARSAYHAASNLAASGLLAVLAEAQMLWARAGLSADAALAALLPLAQGALANAGVQGLAGAVSGPVARGDVRALARHLQAFEDLALSQDLLRPLLARQLGLAQQAGRLSAAQLQALRLLLEIEPGVN